MRKQTKKVLSWILSAAMTLGLATGSGFTAQKASAADSGETEYVDTAYTAANLTFTYTAAESDEAASDTASDTAAYFTGEETASITASGVYTKDVYKTMTTAWTGNIGWIKNPSAGYEISDVKLVLTTADGDIEFALNGGKGAWNEKEQSYNFDFPNIWNANNFPITSIDGSAQIVIDSDANALGLQVAPASDAEATGTPEVTGTPEATTPATGGAVTGDAVTGDATTEPATSDEPDASEEPVESTEPDNTVYATMIYGDSSWNNGHWNPGEEGGTDAKITGDGTYTVSYEKADAVLDLKNVFCVDLVNFSSLENYDKAKISDIKISVDEKELDVAQNIYYYPAGKENKDKQDELIEELKASDEPAILVGDIEDNGNLRIELYNACGINGKTLNKPAFDIDTVGSKISVTFTLSGLKADDPSVAENDKIWETDGVHAYVYYQTAAWDCRNDFSAALSGKAPEEVDAFAEYSYRYIKAGGADVSKEADVTDVLIKEDGTYTVKIAGIDLSGADSFNQLGISTDLAVPEDEQKAGEDAEDEGKDFDWSVSVSDVTVKIDGETVPEGLDKCVLPHNAESPYYLFTAANIWSENEKIPYNKNTDALEAVPEDSIEITFTIKGIPTAGPEASATPEASSTPGASAAPTQTATPGTSVTPAAVATATPDTVLVKEGATVSVGNFKYKVTKAATAKTAGTVKLAGLTKKGKKAKKLTLPASIKKGSAKLNVTALGGSAFKGAKATSITIKSKKVTKLPSKVFANCKKLKTLKLAAKLKSVNKKAFKGCKKTIKIKGASKKDNKKVIKKVYKKTK